MQESSEVFGFEIVMQECDYHRDTFGIVDKLPSLDEAMRYCREHDAILVYVNLGRWRRSDLFKRKICEFERAGGKTRRLDYEEIITFFEHTRRIPRTPADKRATQADYRQNLTRRVEKIATQFDEYKTYNKRKLMNFYHLAACAIHRKIFDCLLRGMSDDAIASVLNHFRLLTVDGRKWNKDNVRKTRAIVDTEEFTSFEFMLAYKANIASTDVAEIDVNATEQVYAISSDDHSATACDLDDEIDF